MTVWGIKKMFDKLFKAFEYFWKFYELVYRIIHPNLQPGPSHLFVSPEHLKIVTS